jgi:hypothetical protein
MARCTTGVPPVAPRPCSVPNDLCPATSTLKPDFRPHLRSRLWRRSMKTEYACTPGACGLSLAAVCPATASRWPVQSKIQNPKLAGTVQQFWPESQQKVPSFGQKVHNSRQKVPSSRQKVPSSRQKVPSFGQKVPSSRQKVPSFGRKVPSSRQKSANPRQNPTSFPLFCHILRGLQGWRGENKKSLARASTAALQPLAPQHTGLPGVLYDETRQPLAQAAADERTPR